MQMSVAGLDVLSVTLTWGWWIRWDACSKQCPGASAGDRWCSRWTLFP